MNFTDLRVSRCPVLSRSSAWPLAALLLGGCPGKGGDSTTDAVNSDTSTTTGDVGGATDPTTAPGPTDATSSTTQDGSSTTVDTGTTGDDTGHSSGAFDECELGFSFDGAEEGCDLLLTCPEGDVGRYSCYLDTCTCTMGDQVINECPVADTCDELQPDKLVDSARACCGWDI